MSVQAADALMAVFGFERVTLRDDVESGTTEDHELEVVMSEEFKKWHMDTYDYFLEGNPNCITRWLAWQASRAALVVELPERDISAYGGPDSEMGPSAEQYEGVGYNWALDACRDAIHAAGVKTK